MKKLVILAVCLLMVSGPASANLLLNGDFSMGSAGWVVWNERGSLTFDTSAGDGHTYSNNYNGGIYQTFATTPGVTYFVSGEIAPDPYVANYMWAEVLLINDAAQVPVNGSDLGPGGNVIGMAKEDSWTAGAWGATFDQMRVWPTQLSFVAAGNAATLVLKSGNVGGPVSGVRWDNVTVVPEPASMTVLAAGLAGLLIRRKR